MDGERRIVALSLFLTAGVGVGAVVTGRFALHIHLWAMGCSLLAAGLLFLLALPSCRREWVCYPLAGVVGMLCYLTAVMPPVLQGGTEFTRAAAEGLKAAIDRLPFTDEAAAPLLKAFLTGDRGGLSRAQIATFRASGASHLLALSGLHIGIIYLLFSRILLVLGNTPGARAARFVITVPAALLFTLMTGASPSIVRAFLFITVSELTVLLGRRKRPLRVFSVALIIQLVLTPQVITSIGFQLSYCAMLGIFLLFPPMQRWYPAGSRFNPIRKIWEAAALSIACQATTAPLAWMYFHSFPRYFLITNILSLPLTTATLSLGIAALVLSALGICPPVLISVTGKAASLLLRSLEIIASM